MQILYDNYFKNFENRKYHRYLEQLEQKSGTGYTISRVPLFLEPRLIQRLSAATDSLLRLLASPAYQQETEAIPWSLPQHPMTTRDYFGCADYYLTDEGPKLLEVNMGPAGRIALVELMEHLFCHHFSYPRASSTSRSFNERMVRAISENFTHKRIAIAVSHLPSSRQHLTCYRYLEEILESFGVHGKVVYANEMDHRDGAFVHQGEKFDRIYNLVIPFVWDNHSEAFTRFQRLFQSHPDSFFPNPTGARLATKALLPACMEADNPRYGLALEDIEQIENIRLPAVRLSDYVSTKELLDAFGGEGQLVLKPIKDYGANGVLIKPDRETVKRIMNSQAEHYIAQAYCPAQKRPFLSATGERTTRMALVRLFFTDGRYSGMRGYLQEAHCDCNQFYIAPVLTASAFRADEASSAI
ncbi:MAG: hypothetical protein MI756_20765 [Chromatiales bacterium]|nr:hypothetical protein [Chromatiales bacterium]